MTPRFSNSGPGPRQRGREPTVEEAAARLRSQVEAAEAHIRSLPSDGSVFGLVYDEPSGKRSGKAAGVAAERAAQTAEAFLRRAESPETPEEQREAFGQAAVDALNEALQHDPNNPRLTLKLVRGLHGAGRTAMALIEWGKIYCKQIPVAAMVEHWCLLADSKQRQAAFDDPRFKRAREVYLPLVKTGLIDEVHRAGRALGAQSLYGRGYVTSLFCLHAGHPVAALAEVLKYPALNHVVGPILNVEQGLTPWRLVPSKVQFVREIARKLTRSWRESELPMFPACMRGSFNEAVQAMGQLLSRSHMALMVQRGNAASGQVTGLRVEACRTLAEIPLVESLALLEQHEDDSDQRVRQAVAKARESVGRALGALVGMG